MDIVKIIGVGLIAVIIIIIVKQYKPEFVIYISIIAGAIILIMSLDKVSAIIDMINELVNNASIDSSFIKLLIKITGIAMITEFAVSICKDSGENAIATKVDMGGKVMIMAMSVPIISGLLETIVKILP